VQSRSHAAPRRSRYEPCRQHAGHQDLLAAPVALHQALPTMSVQPIRAPGNWPNLASDGRGGPLASVHCTSAPSCRRRPSRTEAQRPATIRDDGDGATPQDPSSSRGTPRSTTLRPSVVATQYSSCHDIAQYRTPWARPSPAPGATPRPRSQRQPSRRGSRRRFSIQKSAAVRMMAARPSRHTPICLHAGCRLCCRPRRARQ
jgi:hypothetical protein